MKAYLLVQGDSNTPLLERLLPPEIRAETTVVAVGERSNITSKASSLLMTRRKPVAVVADANAIEKGAVAERRELLEELVGWGSAGVPWKVIVAVPVIESWFFDVPEALERLSGQHLSPAERELGALRPKEILKRLFGEQTPVTVDKLPGELTEAEIETLRQSSPRKELIEFLMQQVNKTAEPQTV